MGNAPRFALLDYHYESEDGRPQEKMTFVFWSPDEGANVKDKMLYASSKDAIKKKFKPLTLETWKKMRWTRRCWRNKLCFQLQLSHPDVRVPIGVLARCLDTVPLQSSFSQSSA